MVQRLFASILLVALAVFFVFPPPVARAGPEEGSSGVIHASLQTGLLAEAELIRNVTLDRTTGFSRARTPPSPETWLRLLRSDGKWTGAGTANYEGTLTTGLVGWDTVSGPWRFGLLAGGSRGDHRVPTYESVAESGTTQAGAYAAHFEDDRGWVFGFTVGSHALVTVRGADGGDPGFGDEITPTHLQSRATSVLPGVAPLGSEGSPEGYKAGYRARSVQLFGEWNRTIREQDYTWQPFVSVAWWRLTTDAFAENSDEGTPTGPPPGDEYYATETSKGTQADLMGIVASAPPMMPMEAPWEDEWAALSAGPGMMELAATDVGVRVSSDLDLGSIPGVVHGTIAWRHLFGPVAPTAHTSGYGDDLAPVTGARFGSGLTIGAGLNVRFSDTWSFDMAFAGRVGPARDQRFVLQISANF